MLSGDLLRGEVVIAPRVGPAHVVEEQQRQLTAPRALGDETQLV